MINPELFLLSPIAIQNSIEKAQWVDIQPLNNITLAPIEFSIPKCQEYLDLSQTFLYLNTKITKADGTAYAKDAKDSDVTFVNNAMHSMFSNIILTLNDETIDSSPDNNYPYKAIMPLLVGGNEQNLKGILLHTGFIKDDAGKMDDVTNSAIAKRKEWTAAGAEKEFFGRLSIDLFQQQRYLINGIDLKLKLVRSKNEFALFHTGSEKPKIVIKEAILYVRKCKINPEIEMEHAFGLSKQLNAQYPIQHTEVLSTTIASGSAGHRADNLFYGKVPKTIILGMVSNDAYNASYAKNPFNFQHFNLNSLRLLLNGDEIPFQPFTPDFATKKCLKEYMSLYQSLGDSDRTLAISYDEWLNGYTLFVFNLSPDLSNNPQFHANLMNMRLDMKFSQALAAPITLLLHATFDANIFVNENRNVFTDFK